MAASTYLDQVQQLYIGYFGRPADPGGLAYWSQQIDAAGGNLSVAVAGFSASAESQALYGNLTPAQQVTAVYQNLFGRAPEPAGLAFWVGLLNNGTFSPSQMSLTILQSAGPGDATSVANKLTAATAFTAGIDTPAELAGYSGTNAAAAARAFLSKVDSTPASIADLATIVTAAVAGSTGAPPPPASGGGSEPPPPFSAAKDGSNAVTFVSPGAAISVAFAGSTYTFTSGTTVSTVSGTVLSIAVPTGTTLTAAMSVAGGIIFSGTGTLALTDTSATASNLKVLEVGVSGLLDASSVTTITGSTSVADATLLLSTKNGSSGDRIKTAPNVALTLADATNVSAADLNTIKASTTGLVDFSGASNSITGTLADVNTLLAQKGTTGNAINLSGAISITLGDSSLAAAAVNTLLTQTTGTVNISGATTLTGALADVNTLLGASHISASPSVNVTLSDSTAAASALNTLDGNTSGLIGFSAGSITLTGTLADVNTLYTHNASSGNGVNIPTAANITLGDGSLAASALSTLDGLTSGLIGFSAGTVTLTGTLADVNTLYTHFASSGNGVNIPAAANITLSDTTLVATDLNTLDGKTTGTVDFSGAGNSVTGALADVTTLFSHKVSAGSNGVNLAANVNVTLSDTSLTAAALDTLQGQTTGLVDISGATTTLTGSTADMAMLFTHQASTAPGVKTAGSVALTLDSGTASAADLNTLDGKTSGTVDFSATGNTVTGTLAQVNMLLDHKVAAGNNGVNLAAVLNITLGDTSLAASDLSALDGRTDGLIGFSATGLTLTGTLAEVNTLYTHNASSGNGVNIPAAANITLSDGTLAASDLNTLYGRIGGLIGLSAGTVTLTGTLADVNTLYTHNGTTGNGVSIPAAANITLGDTTLAATDLNTLDTKTSGTVDFSGANNTVTGTLADVNTLLGHKVTAGNNGVNLADSVNITPSDTTSDAATLKSIETHTTGLVDASTVSSLTASTVADVLQILSTDAGSSGDKIKMAGNVAVTLSDASASITELLAVDSATTSLVDASSVTAYGSMTLAQATQLLVTENLTQWKHAANVTLTLTDTSATPAALNAIDAATTGLVSANGVTALSGLTAEVAATLTGIGTGGISATSLASITLTDAVSAASFNSAVFNNNTTINLAAVTGNSLTLAAGNVTGSNTLTIDGSAATGSETIDASAAVSTSILTINGGAGDDTISSGKGFNTLTGGAGNDTFVFSASNFSTFTGGQSGVATDTITDYRAAGAGTDVISFSGFTPQVGSNWSTVQDFTTQGFVSSALNWAASRNNANNGMTVFIFNNDVYVYVEATGSNTAYNAGDFVVKLAGAKPLFAEGSAITGLGFGGL